MDIKKLLEQFLSQPNSDMPEPDKATSKRILLCHVASRGQALNTSINVFKYGADEGALQFADCMNDAHQMIQQSTRGILINLDGEEMIIYGIYHIMIEQNDKTFRDFAAKWDNQKAAWVAHDCQDPSCKACANMTPEDREWVVRQAEAEATRMINVWEWESITL